MSPPDPFPVAKALFPGDLCIFEYLRCFRVVVTSEAFRSKMQPARHRMVYALLRDKMAQVGGIHALQLRTRTPEEEERQKQREEAESGERIADVELK